MPTFYLLRDGHKTRGPMDADSARLLLAEKGAAGHEVAEVRPGAPEAPPAFGPAEAHPLWTQRAAAHEAAPSGTPWLTTETSGWPNAERLGVVGADRLGAPADAARLREEVLDELARSGAALGAEAVVAVAVAVTGHGDGLVVSATGTALRLTRAGE